MDIGESARVGDKVWGDGCGGAQNVWGPDCNLVAAICYILLAIYMLFTIYRLRRVFFMVWRRLINSSLILFSIKVLTSVALSLSTKSVGHR